MQTALTVAQRRLPVEMTTPPSFRKVNPGDFPVLFIALSSATLPLSTVDEYGDNRLAQQISQIPGVAQVLIYGAQKFAVRVQADPEAAAARNMSLDDIRTALSQRQLQHAGRHADRAERRTSRCRPPARCDKAADYQQGRRRLAQRRAGQARRGRADVIDSVENDKIASWFNGERADRAGDPAPARRQHRRGGRSRAGAAAGVPRADSAVDQHASADRPLDLDPRGGRGRAGDAADRRSVLVILVIFLFLRSVSATIIPALAVPISLVGTCAAMYAFGFSINNMTLLALTLSVGFVVDDAIVMLENIVRHIEGGMRPFEAALKGSREIGFTIVSITFSLIAVFIPVLLMGGIVGRVFREFAVTIAVAIVVSGFVSLTLTPMLCARVLRGHHERAKKQNIVLRAFEADVQALAARLRMDARPRAWRSSS